MPEDYTIREPGPADHETWLAMRMALWPSGTVGDHTEEMAQYLRDQDLAVFLAFDAGGEPFGFAEACLRSHAEDCSTRPVAIWRASMSGRNNGGAAWAEP
jgi:aminoglycoside 6'-N-acetyltransferase I